MKIPEHVDLLLTNMKRCENHCYKGISMVCLAVKYKRT